MNVVKAANVLNYPCGCIAEWQLIGAFAHIPEWHIIPCFKHAENVHVIEKRATADWEEITSGVKK